jgi:hypothetical protein
MAEELGDADLRENRFAYLLQPIRDLAANWDINIAAELEEYLDELENLTFAIEGAGPSLNFAEAALLIQVRAAAHAWSRAPHNAQPPGEGSSSQPNPPCTRRSLCLPPRVLAGLPGGRASSAMRVNPPLLTTRRTLQGTTCVYSKKVEYLHNLVYQALETILNKRQKDKQSGRGGKDKAASSEHPAQQRRRRRQPSPADASPARALAPCPAPHNG